MSFIKTVKSRTFSRIFATTLSALLMAFNINFAHADIISASELMCPNVLHDGVSASSCSKSGFCIGSNVTNLSDGDWSVEFDYGTLEGSSSCGSWTHSSGATVWYSACSCKTSTFTPVDSEDAASVLSESVHLKSFSGTSGGDAESSCRSGCAAACAEKVKKDFEFRDDLYGSAVGCIVSNNYPSEPCTNLLKNGNNINYVTSDTTVGDDSITENFQPGDWSVEFDYGTLEGLSSCGAWTKTGNNGGNTTKWHSACSCRTSTFTPTDSGEIERAVSEFKNLKSFSSTSSGGAAESSCKSGCAAACADKVKKDFQFRQSLYNTKTQCNITLTPKNQVCAAILNDGENIKSCAVNASSCDSVDEYFQPGNWSVDFGYGTIKGVSSCGSWTHSSGATVWYSACSCGAFTPVDNGDTASVLSESVHLKSFSGTSGGDAESNCKSGCAAACADKVKKDFEFREKLFDDTNSFNCPISSSFPEFLKTDTVTLYDGNTTKSCAVNASSCDSIDENFQPGDWSVEFDYGTLEGLSSCGAWTHSSGATVWYSACSCRTSTFTPIDSGEIERAVSEFKNVKSFSGTSGGGAESNCKSECAAACADKVKKDFQFRENLYGGEHTNATNYACKDITLSGNTTKACAVNASNCDSVDEYFQPGDWSVDFDYGTIEGVSSCGAWTRAKPGGITTWYSACSCRTSTFISTDTGEIERAVSSEYKNVKSFSSTSSGGAAESSCKSGCAAACANSVSTDQTYREKLMTTSMVGLCSGAEHPYTINYDNRGGTGCDSLSYGENESINLCEPTYSPKRFTGWATSSSGDPVYPAGYTVQSKSLSLYAGWNEDCGDGLYGTSGSCQACPNGFNHTRSGSTENTQCYAICPGTPSCPPNAATCKYIDADENNYDYYTTNETSICDIEVLTCTPGSIINKNKTACIQCSKVLYNDQCVDSCPSGTEAQNGVCVETQQPVVTITLDWNENGGNAISNGSCEYNNNLVLPSAPIRDGYTFNGWKLADNSIHNAGETITGGCIDTYIGTTTGTSNIITAQWSNCGTGYYCQNGIKTQCPESYPNTDSDTVSSAADCYAVKTAVCTQNECSNPNSVGCSGVTCGTCSCTGSTYKQYSNSTGTGDGVTEGTTTESCDKPIVSLTASLGYYIDGTSGCSICPGGYRNGTNAQNIHECYRECTTNDIPHSSVVTGNDYYGMPDTCSALSCATHYHTYTNPDLMTEIGVDEAGNGFGYISIDGETTYNDYIYGLNAIDDKGKIIINYGSKGLVKGKAQCSSRNATEPFVDNTYILQSDSTIAILPDSTGRNCYCRLDGYTPYGSTTTVALAEPWVLFGSDNFSDAEDCAGSCTYYCAGTLHNAYEGDIAYRTAMFNSLNYPYQVCAPDTYTVSFVTNGAGIIDDISYIYGDTPIDLPQPDKDGFTFEGWFEDSDFQTLANNQYAPNDTITLYAKWSNCGAGCYCQNGVKTQCPESYPNTDSDTVSSAADCYAVKTAVCIKNDCVNPDSTGCDVVCEDCSCAGSTYKQYANSDGTGDGVTEGNTIESCTKQISSLSAKPNHYLDNGTCPVCNVSFTTVETETSGATCPDGTVKSNATGTQQSYSLTCYHQTSTGGDIDSSECTGTQSCEERVYSTCEITGCNQGYYLTSDNTICQECPTGYTCDGGTEEPQHVVTITLDWDENGGNAISNGSCEYNNNLVLPSAPNRDGYMFAGWKLADNSTHNAGETITGGCTSTHTGVSSGTSTYIVAQWTECGTGYYCQNGVKTQCPESYPNTDSDTVSSVADCYSVQTATCIKQGCVNPDSTGCDVVCEDCSCAGSTYKQYANLDGTGDGVTEGNTIESCAKQISSLSAKANHYLDNNTCPVCNVPFTTVETETSGATCPDGTVKSNATGTQQSYSLTCYHQTSTGGEIDSSECTGTQSCEERVYSACEITGCNQGYYLTSDNTICQECPTGYTCDGGTEEPQPEQPTNCNAGQIIYENECVDNNFQVTTIPGTNSFRFAISSQGTFYIDCDVNSNEDTVVKLEKNDLNEYIHTCTYSKPGTYTIGLGGAATGYKTSYISDYSLDSTSGKERCSTWSSVRFNVDAVKVASVNGSLGKVFPTLPDGSQPTFRGSFSSTRNLTSVPSNLFDGVHGTPGVCMFAWTFSSGNIKNIPLGLFSYISGTAEGLFVGTFAYAHDLEKIDVGIFRTIKGEQKAFMFYNTFNSGSHLFTSVPEDLFGGITGTPSGGLLYDTFRGSKVTKLPNRLFSGLSGQPDDQSLKNMFALSSNLSGYIPCTFFENLDSSGFTDSGSTSPLDSIFAGTRLDSSCPADMYQKITGFESDLGYKAVCCQCPNGGTSSAGSVGVNSCSAAAVVCDKNTYLDGSSCSPCPTAYPNSERGARSISQCYATVTYKFNNGDEDISVDTYYSSDSPDSYSIDLPKPSKTDFIFVGWYDNSGFSGDVLDNPATLVGNKTLYAQWTQVKCAPGQYLSLNGLYCEPCPTPYPHSIFDSKNKYACFATVSFYPNNATDNTKENYYYTDALPNGYKITNTPATNTNYEFIGWFENQNFTGNAITTESILVGDKSLYAQYGYSIQYDLDGGSLPNGQSNPAGYTATTSTFTLINPTKTGHIFKGWCESNNNCANPQTTVTITQGSTTGNKHYYAKWTANKYNIIYKDGSDVLSTIQSPTEYTYSINAQTFTPTPEPTKRGFEFLGWSVSSTDTTNYSKTITVPAETTEDITFYAVWDHIGYDIHYHLNGGTNNSENPDNYIISELPLQLHDASRTGYIFAGWFDNAGLAGTPLTEISSDTVGEINLYAKWTAITYNVVFNGNKADGYKSAVVCTYDQYCDISNNNNFTYEGYIYMGWDTNKDSTTPLYPHTSSGISVFNLTNVNNATVLLYAIWKEHRIDLQYLYNDLNNNSEQDSCKYNYIFTPPVPPADAKPGFRFAGWRVETN